MNDRDRVLAERLAAGEANTRHGRRDVRRPPPLRTTTLAVVLTLAAATAGCAPGRDRAGEARSEAREGVRYLRVLLEEAVEDAGPLSDEEFEVLVTTDVADRFDGSLAQTQALDGRSTWHGAALGAADGPVKSHVVAAACFDVEIDRRDTLTLTFADAPCSERVRRTLAVTGDEDNIVSVADLATD